MKSQVIEKFEFVVDDFVINNSVRQSYIFVVDFGNDLKIRFQPNSMSKSLVKYLYEKDRLKECKILVESKSFVDRKTNKIVRYLEYKLFNEKDISISLTYCQSDKELYKFFVKDYIKLFDVIK